MTSRFESHRATAARSEGRSNLSVSGGDTSTRRLRGELLNWTRNRARIGAPMVAMRFASLPGSGPRWRMLSPVMVVTSCAALPPSSFLLLEDDVADSFDPSRIEGVRD